MLFLRTYSESVFVPERGHKGLPAVIRLSFQSLTLPEENVGVGYNFVFSVSFLQVLFNHVKKLFKSYISNNEEFISYRPRWHWKSETIWNNNWPGVQRIWTIMTFLMYNMCTVSDGIADVCLLKEKKITVLHGGCIYCTGSKMWPDQIHHMDC